MMANLFSIFDPTTSSGLNQIWFSSFIFLVIFPSSLFLFKTPLMKVFIFLNSFLSKELFPILHTSLFLSPLFLSLFLSISMINFMGLLPYLFTSSSHMSITLALALPLWLSFFIYGWMVNPKNMLAHLVPSGTPFVLMSFMVLIETISAIIRPLTLAVRLMANMTAGHLIMTLISSQIPLINMMSLGLVMTQTVLYLLETAVAFIQAYVFTLLLTLYLMESK
uniref:ATP synthase subunit a n=1 Tax=Pauropus longiramus TaxID=933850 RepID=G9BG43_9MYRI|nr:ATP synthase F0 subunit 6 [Pauropus longiramus]ADT63081.1 ATP synthase F0 subunit 6 [Pauropus longiramus]